MTGQPAAGIPTRIYYVSYPHNAFDTHVNQADNHARLLTYTSDHIAAFLTDMARIGRGADVTVMAFSEFGRRVAEIVADGPTLLPVPPDGRGPDIAMFLMEAGFDVAIDEQVSSVATMLTQAARESQAGQNLLAVRDGDADGQRLFDLKLRINALLPVIGKEVPAIVSRRLVQVFETLWIDVIDVVLNRTDAVVNAF